jgi:hypothetical protein
MLHPKLFSHRSTKPDRGPLGDLRSVGGSNSRDSLLPETKVPLIEAILSRLIGDTVNAGVELERRREVLLRKSPKVIEKAIMLYGKRVNGMVDPKDIHVYLLRGIDDETGIGEAVLVVGRFDLDGPLIVRMPDEIGEVFTEREIIKANQMMMDDSFALPLEPRAEK